MGVGKHAVELECMPEKGEGTELKGFEGKCPIGMLIVSILL